MLISLSSVPIVLLLVQCVTSVDQYKSKRVPRRHTEVIRTYNSNRPPLKYNYDNIVVFDEQEKKSDSSVSKVNLEGKKSENHPQLTKEIDPLHIVAMNDYETDVILPQKTRSVNGKKRITASDERENGKLKNFRRTPTSSEVDTAPKTHRRRSQVRRVKVSKNKLNEFINKTQSALNETESVVREDIQKVKIHTTNHAKTNNQPNLKRRKGLREAVIPIVESENFVFSHSGDFHYSYEGGDGTKAAERGELKTSKGGAGSAVEGSYSYIGKDGNDYSLTYTADENGYRPVGAHLPTPPPIPPAIKRALDYLATKTTPEPNTERINLLKQGFFL